MKAAMLAIFPVLFILGFGVVYEFVFRFSLPALRDGVITIKNNKLAIGICFLVLGLCLETLFYGVGRYWPYRYSFVSEIYYLALPLKALYCAGLSFLLAWVLKIRTGRSYLSMVLSLSLSLWLICTLIFIFYGV